MEVDIFAKVLLHYRPKGRRERGETRTRWKSSLEIGTG